MKQYIKTTLGFETWWETRSKYLVTNIYKFTPRTLYICKVNQASLIVTCIFIWQHTLFCVFRIQNKLGNQIWHYKLPSWSWFLIFIFYLLCILSAPSFMSIISLVVEFWPVWAQQITPECIIWKKPCLKH